MSDLKFDHIGLADTRRHWPSIQEEDRTPQIYRGHFMSHKLDSTTACNEHDSLLGPCQYGGTASISTGKIIGRNIASGKYPSNIERWSWQKYRGQRKASLRISTFYRPVLPYQGGGPGSVYSQHLTYFNNTNRRICPRQGFLNNLKEEVDKWKK